MDNNQGMSLYAMLCLGEVMLVSCPGHWSGHSPNPIPIVRTKLPTIILHWKHSEMWWSTQFIMHFSLFKVPIILNEGVPILSEMYQNDNLMMDGCRPFIETKERSEKPSFSCDRLSWVTEILTFCLICVTKANMISVFFLLSFYHASTKTHFINTKQCIYNWWYSVCSVFTQRRLCARPRHRPTLKKPTNHGPLIRQI